MANNLKALIQKVSKAAVIIDKKTYNSINEGLLVFLGIKNNDNKKDINFLINKIMNLRIFSDKNHKMNYSIQDVKGEILLISQFTLYADCKKGNRPSFINAAQENIARPLYQMFTKNLKATNISLKTGIFGANMNIELINEGPVTILLESKNEQKN